jgi:hypothetical protein
MKSLYILLAMASVAFAHDPQPLRSTYATSPPTLDGDLADWEQADFISVTPTSGVFDTESATTDDPDDFSFSFAVRNDEQYLYVAVRVTDDIIVLDTNPDPTEKDARAWMDDAIEVFIDGNHSHSPDARDTAGVEFKTGGEFSIVANGAVTSKMSGVPLKNGDKDYWTSQGSYSPAPGAAYQSPWDSEAKEFAIEARFHYRIMGEAVGPGSTIGFTISAHDDDNGGDRDAALYWKGMGSSNWKSEAGWGDLILSAPTAVESIPYAKLKSDQERSGDDER